MALYESVRRYLETRVRPLYEVVDTVRAKLEGDEQFLRDVEEQIRDVTDDWEFDGDELSDDGAVRYGVLNNILSFVSVRVDKAFHYGEGAFYLPMTVVATALVDEEQFTNSDRRTPTMSATPAAATAPPSTRPSTSSTSSLTQSQPASTHSKLRSRSSCLGLAVGLLDPPQPRRRRGHELAFPMRPGEDWLDVWHPRYYLDGQPAGPPGPAGLRCVTTTSATRRPCEWPRSWPPPRSWRR